MYNRLLIILLIIMLALIIKLSFWPNKTAKKQTNTTIVLIEAEEVLKQIELLKENIRSLNLRIDSLEQK